MSACVLQPISQSSAIISARHAIGSSVPLLTHAETRFCRIGTILVESSSCSSSGPGWRRRHRGVPQPAQNILVYAVAGMTVEQFSIAFLRTYRRNTVQNSTLHYITLHYITLHYITISVRYYEQLQDFR